MTKELEAGQWAVFRSPAYGWCDLYDAARIERVTAKTVYARVNSRTQFGPEQVELMPDEATARLVVERIKSAQAEAKERIRRAENDALTKIRAAITKATPEDRS